MNKKGPLRVKVCLQNLINFGVPSSMVTFCLDDFKVDNRGLYDVKQFFTKYLRDIDVTAGAGKGFYLYGSNGTGKTMLSSICVKEFYRWRYTVKRCMFTEYIAAATKSWGEGSEYQHISEMAFFTYFKNVDFLVLDEVGKEIDSKIAIPLLEECIRYRFDKGLITSIVTNMKPLQFDDKYGKSIASIVREVTEVVAIEGDDYRRKGTDLMKGEVK